MRRSILVAAAVAAGGIFLTAAALAQEGEARRAPNLYVGGAFGHSKADKACAGLPGCDQSDNVFGAFAGYWLNRNFAAEVGYYNLGKATADGGTYVRSNAWDFVLVGMLHFASPVSLYGKLGYFRGAQEGGGTLAAPKELVDGLTYGGGVQFQATKNFAVRGEWQSYPEMGGGPVLRTGDITVFRLGALWRFQ